jgi:phospholipid/cholesterol/gamma-HCH transport system substrate-binding protein
MPRTRSLAWSELKIGVLTIAALVIAAVTIFMLTGGKGFFWQRYTLKTRFDNVAGLKAGSPVRVAGVDVGSVTDVSLVEDRVEVTFQVNKAQRERITSTSTAELGSISLLGEYAVDITPSIKGSAIPDGGFVPSKPPKAQLADIGDTVNKGVERMNALLEDVRSGRGTVGKLMTDQQLYEQVTRFATAAGDLTRSIQQGRGSVGRLLNDPRAAESLERSLRSLDEMMARVNAGEGSLGKLLKDDAFSTALSGATANLEILTAKMNRGEGTLGKLATDQELYNRFNSVTNRLDLLMTKLNEGEGTAGQLLHDKQLYENINRVAVEVHDLVVDIRKDPKKFLNVRVSIF